MLVFLHESGTLEITWDAKRVGVVLTMGSGRGRSVLVVGAYKETLVIVRSVARAGFHVIVGKEETERITYPHRSRYATEIWEHPDLNCREFIQALFAYVHASPDIDYVVVAGDLLAHVLATEPLPETPVFVMAYGRAVVNCQDKLALYNLAKGLGIPTPSTKAINNFPEVVEAARAIGFPCVLKPNDTPKPPGCEFKAIICRSEIELQKLQRWPKGALILVQQFAPGMRRNCHFVARAGQMLVYFEQKVLRTDDPQGTGLGVDSVSVAPTATLREYTERLLAALSYSGVGCAQYLLDETTGTAVLLEVNPRFDSTIALPYRCGCDLPMLTLRAAAGETIHSPNYITGCRIHWFEHDFATTLLRLVDDGSRWQMKAVEVLKLFDSLAHADCHMVFDITDPMPALGAAADLFAAGVRKAARKLHIVPRAPRPASSQARSHRL